MTTFVSISTLAGDSMLIDFTVVDANGAAIDLSDAVMQWGIKPKGYWRAVPPASTSEDPLPTWPSKMTGVDSNGISNGITILGVSRNIARVAINKGDIPAGSFMHELEVTLSSGDSFTVASGPFEATPTIFAT